MALFYVGLFDAGGELAALDYVRQAATFNVTGGRTANQASVIWEPSSGWGTVISVGLFAAISGGSALYQANTTQAVLVESGHVYRIRQYALRFSEAIPDTALFDEVLFDQPDVTSLLPAEFAEWTFPPPSGAGLRIMSWARYAQ